ncbi:MAG: hypothetical protein WAU91_22910 [Desulfatitalea sp.]
MPSKRAHLNALREDRLAPGASAPRAGLRAYARLLLGLVIVALFMIAATLFSARLPALRTMGERIDAYNLRPSAIYYTDYEASGDAAALIRSSLEYPPKKQ